MTKIKKILVTLSLVLFGTVATVAHSFDPDRDITVSYKGGTVILDVPRAAHVTELAVKLKKGTEGKLTAIIPPPTGKDTFNADYWSGEIIIPIKGVGLADPVAVIVSFNSCEEGEGGQCFPPTDKELIIKASDIPSDAIAGQVPKNKETPLPTASPADNKHDVTAIDPIPSKANSVTVADSGAEVTIGREATTSATDPFASAPTSKSGLLIALILFFLGGIGASLTPCVLPMIPITMAVIGANSGSKTKGMMLGVVLTQGMALTYTVLGVIAALTGSAFGKFAQHPAFLIPVSLIFALFAISLLGAFEVKLPDSLTKKLQGSRARNGLMGAFVTGLVLGPLSAPCVGPLIGAAIMDIGINQKIFEGALKMFFFAQGMGVLFITGGVAVSALPKSGDWLTRFKQTLGVIILGFAVWNIRLIVPEWANFAMWSITLLLTAGVFGAFETACGLIGNIRKGFALFTFAIAILFGIRATEQCLDLHLLPRGASGAVEATPFHDLWIEHDYELALEKAKAEGKLVLVDTYTDWCAQCKELDEKTWPDPLIVDWIKKNAVAVRIDTEKVRPDLAKPLSVRAYPTIILMDSTGNEIRRLNGFHRPEKMLMWLSNSD